MCGFLGIVTGIFSLVLWVLWTFGATGEYPGRVFGVAIVSAIVAVVLIILSYIRQEYFSQ